MPDKPKPQTVGLPVRAFLYTLDQVAYMLSMGEGGLTANHVHFDGRSVGAQPKDKMLARNVAPHNARPDWRVAEPELIRWMKSKRFRLYERAWLMS